jgi:hypothetical protein
MAQFTQVRVTPQVTTSLVVKVAVIAGLRQMAADDPWPPLLPGALAHIVAQHWLLPAFYERLAQQGAHRLWPRRYFGAKAGERTLLTAVCVADSYFGRALAMARDLQNLTTQMWLLLVFSTYYLGRGNWADAERSLEELIEIARRQGGACVTDCTTSPAAQAESFTATAFPQTYSNLPGHTITADQHGDKQQAHHEGQAKAGVNPA